MMRLFAGVELDEEVKLAVDRLARRLQAHLREVAPDFQARWVQPDNLHITSWFLGEVPEARASAMMEVLRAEPFRTPAFALELAGCGVFPRGGRPRVVWVGVWKGGAELSAIHGELGERLASLGVPPEPRAYAAHLTIARVKDAGRSTARRLHEVLTAFPANGGRCGISAVTLFRSRLSPRGAVYEPLLRVPLSM